MKLKFSLLTKTKTNPSGAVTTVSILIVICLLIILGRFIYVPFINEWDVKFENGLFGFKWLSTFLSRIGNEIAWLAVGFFIHYLTNFFSPINNDIKKYTKYIANIVLATALYFIAWIFYDNFNFSLHTEILFSAATSLMAIYISYKFITPNLHYIDSLLSKIRDLVDVIILKAPEHVKDINVWTYEIVEPTLDKLNE